MKRALAAVALLATAACSNPTSSRLDTLEANRTKFASMAGADYTIVVQRNCFCTPEATQPARLTVRGGAIVGVTRLATGEAGSADGYKTVAELFDYVANALQGRRSGNVAEVRVSYDAQYGYPNDVWVDQSYQIADEEQGYVLRDLQPAK
jgi:hypothetical protein